jgi:membrane fusion protein (multidrug efflux system)
VIVRVATWRFMSVCLVGMLWVGHQAVQAQSAPSTAPVTAVAPAIAATKAADGPSPSGDTVRVLLIADRETTLSSPVTARIKTLNMSIGVSFTAGQSLVGFDCEEPVARLGMAQAELAGAVEMHEAKIRMQGLEQASDVEVALAASAVAKSRAQVALQNAQVGQCSIKAPWAGRVAKVHVRNYMSVVPGQPMVDIVKSGPLRLKLNAPSRLISKVKTGTLFNVAIDETGKSYQARVIAINSRVDPVSQTIEIEAGIIKHYEELLPGMSGIALLNAFN